MKKKLVGKIFAVLFSLFTLAFMFMPQVMYEFNMEIPGHRAQNQILASNIAPIDFIKALFATEADYEQAKIDYQNAAVRIESEDSESSDGVALSNTKEATRFILLTLKFEENPLNVNTETEQHNAIQGIKTYAYISIVVTAVMIILSIVLILRCFFVRNKFLSVFGNIWSILVFASSIGMFFASTIPSVVYSFSTNWDNTVYSLEWSIRSVPIIIMSGAFAIISLVTMILALTTKGVKKKKQAA